MVIELPSSWRSRSTGLMRRSSSNGLQRSRPPDLRGDRARSHHRARNARLREAGGREFDLWLLKLGAEIVPVDAEQMDAARRARRRYGKGAIPPR